MIFNISTKGMVVGHHYAVYRNSELYVKGEVNCDYVDYNVVKFPNPEDYFCSDCDNDIASEGYEEDLGNAKSEYYALVDKDVNKVLQLLQEKLYLNTGDVVRISIFGSETTAVLMISHFGEIITIC